MLLIYTKVSNYQISKYLISSIHKETVGCVWLRILFLDLVGVIDLRWSETPQYVTTVWNISSSSFHWRLLLLIIYSTILWSICHQIIHPDNFTTNFVPRAFQHQDLQQRQLTCIHLMANFALNNTVMVMWDFRIIVHKLPLTQALDQGNTANSIIHLKDIVTLLSSCHFQACGSLITILHSTWHTTVRNQPPAYADNFKGMGQSGKDITSTKVVMVSLKCSPLRQLSWQWPSSPGPSWVPPGPPGNNPVHLLSSFNSTPPPRSSSSLPESSHWPPNQIIPATCGTTKNICHKDCVVTHIAGDFLRQLYCTQCELLVIRCGQCRI